MIFSSLLHLQLLRATFLCVATRMKLKFRKDQAQALKRLTDNTIFALKMVDAESVGLLYLLFDNYQSR